MLLQKPYDFLDSLCEAIAQSRNRVYLQAMVVESGAVMDRVAPLLCDAVKRGVDVRVYYDWVTQRYLHGDILLTPTFNPERIAQEKEQHRQNSTMFADLASHGVTVVETNIPLGRMHFFPVMGRNHRKIYIVDDVAWLGGINFFDASFENIDFMVRFEQHAMVAELSRQCTLVNAARARRDSIHTIADAGILVVDSGKRGTSLIYNQALDMVQGAHTSVVFVSQLVPENHMLDLLLEKARVGVHVTIITSDANDRTFTRYPLRYFYLEFRRRLQRTRGHVEFVHLDRKIHAKLLVVDSEEAFFGSHNFVESGVRMGTQEIAFRSRDSELVGQLVHFVDDLT